MKIESSDKLQVILAERMDEMFSVKLKKTDILVLFSECPYDFSSLLIEDDIAIALEINIQTWVFYRLTGHAGKMNTAMNELDANSKGQVKVILSGEQWYSQLYIPTISE